MAKKVKFPLDMGKDNDGNDILVREISELKKHYNAEKVTEYFLNGKLLTWLKDRYYDEEAEMVEELSKMSDKEKAAKKLPEIFGIEIKEAVDIEELEIRRKKLEKLRAITSDDEILDNVDSVAFSQEDLGDLLDEGAEVVYLCGKSFSIPLSVEKVRYIGVNEPTVSIGGTGNIIREDDGKVVEKEKEISVEQCKLSEDTENKIKETMKKINDNIVIEKYGNSGDSNKDYVPQDTANKSYDDFVIDYFGKRVCLKKYTGNDKNVKIPDNVTEIGKNAFSMCDSVRDIRIPDEVTEIGTGAFMYCKNLEYITLPHNLIKIGEAAFYGCEKIEYIYIPNGIEVIGDSTFNGCYSLKRVCLPDSLSKIGKNVFDYCNNIWVEYKNQTYSYIDIDKLYNSVGTVYSKDNEFEFEIKNNKVYLKKYNGTNNTIIKIPDNVNVIGNDVFAGRSVIEEVIIPNSVTVIGGWAFAKCINLRKINIPDGMKEIGYNAFENCKSLTQISFPNTLQIIKSNAFHGCEDINVAYCGYIYKYSQIEMLFRNI